MLNAPRDAPRDAPFESALLSAFAEQVAWCEPDAPFTARLLERTQAWLAADQSAHAIFAAAAPNPRAAATPLRWAGALHHLALRGLLPWAALWPPAQTNVSDDQLDAAIASAWREQRPHVLAALALPPQTNEVQRSAILLPGLLHIAAATGLPLSLLEIGASAGLNLWCERYFYDYGTWCWGDPAAALKLRSEWVGPIPTAGSTPLKVLRRAACDANPIELTKPDEALRLKAFIWADQAERLARCSAAQHEAARWLLGEGVKIEALPAAQFVQRELTHPRQGAATVLYHSIVWQYIAPAEQAAITHAVQSAAARATTTAPLAWLRFEFSLGTQKHELRCTLWPGGVDRQLAFAHPHGARIQWLG